MSTRSDTNRWLVLVIVCVAQFMVVLDATIVNVALPSIQQALHFSPSSLQWIVNAYTLVFGGFLLLGGRAADLFGRQLLFIVGVVVFTAASLLNGLASTSNVLIGGRALQGLGAALVSPAALSIVTTTFAEGRERTQALGVWSAIAAGGGAVGLVVGGFLTDVLSWRWVFFINLPIGIAAVILAVRYVPNSRAAKRPETVDVAGAVSVTAGLLVLVYDIVKAQEYGWTSGRTLGLAALAALLLAAFVAIEHRSRAPLIRLSIFRIRSLTASNGAMLFVTAGLFAMFYFASLYVQDVLGYSPLKAGLAFLPVTAGIVIGAALSQVAIKAMSARRVPLIGIALASGGLFLLGRVPTHGSYLHDLLPGLLLMSIGIGLVFVPLTLIATTNIESEDAGLASGLLNTTQQVGGALGLAILSTLATSKTNSVVDCARASSLDGRAHGGAGRRLSDRVHDGRLPDARRRRGRDLAHPPRRRRDDRRRGVGVGHGASLEGNTRRQKIGGDSDCEDLGRSVLFDGGQRDRPGRVPREEPRGRQHEQAGTESQAWPTVASLPKEPESAQKQNRECEQMRQGIGHAELLQAHRNRVARLVPADPAERRQPGAAEQRRSCDGTRKGSQPDAEPKPTAAARELQRDEQERGSLHCSCEHPKRACSYVAFAEREREGAKHQDEHQRVVVPAAREAHCEKRVPPDECSRERLRSRDVCGQNGCTDCRERGSDPEDQGNPLCRPARRLVSRYRGDREARAVHRRRSAPPRCHGSRGRIGRKARGRDGVRILVVLRCDPRVCPVAVDVVREQERACERDELNRCGNRAHREEAAGVVTEQ